ncbi:phage tail fiber protein [Sphingomonas sp.]|uniref:phage tail fiber domain-containing protein n=1 Tax=Sphingomonas sp. TaxID=28214 RepID=UPI002ED91270
MATQVTYVGDGSTVTFAIPFVYEAGDIDLHVAVDGVETEFTLDNPATARITPAPAIGAAVRIFRKTPFTSRDVVFENSAVLSDEDLNRADEQIFRRVEEVSDDVEDTKQRAVMAPEGQEGFTLGGVEAGQVLGLVDGKLVGVPNNAGEFIEDATAALQALQTLRDEAEGIADDVAEAGAAVAADRAAVEAARATIEDDVNTVQGVAITRQFYPGARGDVPQGLTGATIGAAGSGGADGSYAVPLSGGNLSVDAYVRVIVAGGAVAAVGVAAPGLYLGDSLTIGTVDLSSIAGLTGATVNAIGGYLVASGEFYYTDHASDDEQVARFQNQANVAVEVTPSVSFLKIALARSYAEAAQAVYDEFQSSLTRGFNALAERVEPLDNGAWPDTSFGAARMLSPGAFDCGGADSDIEPGALISGWDVRLQLLSGASKLTITLLRCALSSPYINDRPTADAGWEEVIPPFDLTVASLGLTAGLPAGQWENARLVFPEEPAAEDGYAYVPVIDVKDGSNASMNFGRGTVVIASGSYSGAGRKQGWAKLFGTDWNGLGGAPDHAFYSRVLQRQVVDPAALEERIEVLEEAIGSGADPALAVDFLWPDEFCATEGRPLSLFLANSASKRIDRDSVVFSLGSLAHPPKHSLLREGAGMLEIDTDRVGSTIQFLARKRGEKNTRYVKTMPATIVPWVSAAAPRILIIGDSLGQQVIAGALAQNLEARGASPQFIGTILTSDWNNAGGNGNGGANEVHQAEARGGKALADFTHQRVYDPGVNSTMRPVAEGGEAAYLALTAAQIVEKMSYNPFLKASAGADSFNGYRFDLGFYLTRFGFPSPTHIILSLGTNDLFQGLMGGYTTGLTALLNRIRAYSADIEIILYHDAWGLGPQFEHLKEGHYDMQVAAANLIRDRGDSKIHWLPVGLFMSEQMGWKLTVSGTDTDTGLATAGINIGEAGEVHPAFANATDAEYGVNVAMAAEALASMVVATT